ncbi:MAG TPA: c-type cytochrome, partial [Gemmatimonadales bacterium]|nr:c-type cytochrome [Gemmatimonadales bacterium]
MAEREVSTDRLWLWFAIVSVVMLVVLAISPVKDYFRQYRRYQNDYRALMLKSAGTLKQVRRAREEAVGIRQIWIPELDNHVDRCTTCHLGIDEPAMAQVPQPFRTHPRTPHTPGDLQRFGCVVCHQGQGRATSLAEAHGEVPDWDSPLLPVRYTEASCGRCHEGDEVPEASLLSAGRQLITRVGCAGCHKLGGSDKEVVPRVGPDLNGLSQKTNPAWLHAWLKEPRSLRPDTWMPDFHLSGEEIDDLVEFLWAQPPTAGQALEGGAEAPGDTTRGRLLFSRSRCISCHTVEGKGNGSAPELSGIGSMVTRRWLVSFLADPQGFQPETRMPRYDLSRQDRLDLAAYMMDEFTDTAAPAPAPPLRPAQKKVQAGEQVWKKYGCAGCHKLGGSDKQVVPRVGPDLNGLSQKTNPAWLRAWL